MFDLGVGDNVVLDIEHGSGDDAAFGFVGVEAASHDEDMAIMAIANKIDRRQLTQMEVLRVHRKAFGETSLTRELWARICA